MKVTLTKPIEYHNAVNFWETVAEVLSDKHGVMITPIFKSKEEMEQIQKNKEA